MTSDAGEANLAVACAFVDELGKRGVRHAVICPGSRSTPLALALTAHPDLREWVLVDERSAAFFALGIARQLAAPVALLSTSGTAAANFLPAIAEAQLNRVPLIVLTADRPPELRGWGAAQTIDQLRLYGEHIKWFADMPVPETYDAFIRQARGAAARAVQTATSDPAGPAHLNLPFREPLLPTELRPPLRFDERFRRGRATGPPLDLAPPRLTPSDDVVSELASLTTSRPRGIIVCGPGEAPGLAPAVTALGAAIGYPVLADPLSGVRFGDHDHSHVIDAYDPFLRHDDLAAKLRPDSVIRVGAIPTSKPLQQFLLSAPGRPHVVVDPGELRDPDHLATDHIQADVAATLQAVAHAIGLLCEPRDGQWISMWRDADRAARTAIADTMAADDSPFEGRAAAEVAALLPEGATLVVGNSMPVRDVDAFVRGDRRRLRIVGNRGANGIDGLNSAALGAAAVSPDPVVLLVGDLSFWHDLNGLFAAKKYGLDATIVVLNNDGGGIFSFLPQAGQLDRDSFETLFGTPTGLDIATAAQMFGASFSRPNDWPAFRREVCRSLGTSSLGIVELVTDRERNVAQHRAVWATVAGALSSLDVGGA